MRASAQVKVTCRWVKSFEPKLPPAITGMISNREAAYPPTPAMKRFADSLSRQKGIKPPPGYKTSISICRKFLSDHASKTADGKMAGKLDPKPVSPAQLLYAKKIAQGKGIIIPDDAKTNSAAMSAWIDSNRGKTRHKHGPKTTYQSKRSVALQSTAPAKRTRKRKGDPLRCATDSRSAKIGKRCSTVGTDTNIEVALKLGTRC
jgi:DNA topoisomerase-3